MQKKIVLALLLTALTAAGAFAQLGLSVGVGGLFDMSFRNGIKTEIGDKEVYGGNRNRSIGGYIFFDATYAELDVYFAFGSLSSVLVGADGVKYVNGIDGKEKPLSATQLGFSLLGKFPINLGGVTVFPLLGLDYNIVLSVKDKDSDEKLDNPGFYNQFGFLAGVGGDFNLSKSLFIRAEGLFHLRLASKTFKDVAEDNDKAKATWGMGPQIKLGLGFRF